MVGAVVSIIILLSSFKFKPAPITKLALLPAASFNVPAERAIDETPKSLLLSVAPTVYVPVALFELLKGNID